MVPVMFSRCVKETMVAVEPGKWKQINTHNYDEYLKELGVGMIARTAIKASTQEVELSGGDQTWTLKTSAVKTTQISFALGEEFEEILDDKRTYKSVITVDDGKLIHQQVGSERESTIVREFNDRGMTAQYTVNGVTAVLTYEKL
ncbi:lipocalin/fatty-acid binding family protein [Streptomyces sp. NPDC003042]